MVNFKLSLGKQDSIHKQIEIIKQVCEVEDKFYSEAKVQVELNAFKKTPEFQACVNRLMDYVPYAFLRPWYSKELKGLSVEQVKFKDRVRELTANDANAPYSFTEDGIRVNKSWQTLLKQHNAVLKGFAENELAKFLENRNFGTPGVIAKISLVKRCGLTSQTNLWKEKLNSDKTSKFYDIYSRKSYPISQLSLDHFVPWRYEAHCMIWNLIPCAQSVNSSKSDNLPDVSLYLEPFLEAHFDFIKFLISADVQTTLSDYENYLGLGNKDLTNKNKVFDAYVKRLSSTIEQAGNMGFEKGWSI